MLTAFEDPDERFRVEVNLGVTGSDRQHLALPFLQPLMGFLMAFVVMP